MELVILIFFLSTPLCQGFWPHGGVPKDNVTFSLTSEQYNVTDLEHAVESGMVLSPNSTDGNFTISVLSSSIDEIQNVDCFLIQDLGVSYRGTADTTVNGFKCLPWTAGYPQNNFFTPYNFPTDGLQDGAYCRNPGGSQSAPWCVVNDPSGKYKYDFCQVPSCAEDHLKCFYGSGQQYRGTHGFTVSGHTCQNWASSFPHQHLYLPSNYADDGIHEHNYCRNPQGFGAPWCYTVDKAKRWEYCAPVDCLGMPNNEICQISAWSDWSECVGNDQNITVKHRSRAIQPRSDYDIVDCPERVFEQTRLC